MLVEDKEQIALVYFRNEDSYIARQRNLGFIRIDDCLSISVVGDYLGKPNAFTITTPKHKYCLVSESRLVEVVVNAPFSVPHCVVP